jgi:hypothetical protein
VKYRFIEETDSLPSASVSPLVAIPTGDSGKGLGNGGSQRFLPLWLSKRWASLKLTSAAGTGLATAPNWKNYWFFGLQAQYDFSDHWILGGEVFCHSGEQTGQRSSVGFNIEGVYNFDEHNHFLFSAGKGLLNAAETNRVSTYVAYSFTY